MNRENVEEILKKLGAEDVPADVHKIAEEASEDFNKTLTPSRRHILWSDIMKSRITKLAAAAVMVITVLVGIHQFGGSLDGAGVAWAGLAERVEQIRTSIYRSKTSIEGLSYVKGGALQETEGFAYYSADYGMRRDKYENGGKIVVEHWIPTERAIVTINPQTKTYSRKFFTEEEFRNKYNKREWKEFIKHFMSFEYTELGRETINGVEVEGIEVNDPKVMLETAYESVVVRLWVDVKTNLPVRIEMRGAAGNGSIKCEQIVDVVELDGEVEASVFEPNIPGDYTLFAEAEINDKNEGIAVQGLHIFAEITGGRYPSSLAILTAVNELWKARSGKKLSKEEVERGITVQSTCSFYAALDQADKDVAYYGDSVTAEDADSVLMRWKVLDDQSSMVAIGYSVLADHQLAEDAAQEAFARALSNLRALKNKTKFAPWLAAICRNVAKDMVATKVRQINTEDFSGIADNDNRDDEVKAVRQAIEQLSVSAKELIIFRYYNGLSYEQIGSVLGISKATINGRLTRAKRKMAKYLRRNGFLES